MRDTNLGRIIVSYFEKRFGSKPARFRSAVAIGFVVTTVGFFLAGPNARPSMADDSFWGAMSTLFNGSSSFDGSSSQSDYATVSRPISSRHYRPRSMAHLRHTHAIVRHTLAADAIHQASGHTMCVRLCDGYAFPVGPYHGKSDNAAHQAICQSSCPDAKTALYVMPEGSDEIGKGVDVASGRNYSELPDAFHYTTVLDDACTCHKDGIDGKALSLLRDVTLRRGDAVMTAKGIRVFRGSKGYPFRRADFVGLTHSRDIKGANRATMKAIERASLEAVPSVAKPAISRDVVQLPRPGVPEFATSVTPLEPVGPS